MVYPEKKRYFDRGYVYIYMPNHPSVNKRPYVAEHTIVMEEYIGRTLTKEEVVHHIDGDKSNNNIENLLLLDKKTHTKIHNSEKRSTMVPLVCAYCGKLFYRRVSLVRTKYERGQVYFFCTRRCMGKASPRKFKNYSITKMTVRVLERTKKSNAEACPSGNGPGC